MKKFINDVWTIQLPRQEININYDVPVSAIKEFVKGKGEWGQNALYHHRKDSFTVFDSTSEATNYLNYTKQWDRSFIEILDSVSTFPEFNGIIRYINTYKDDLVSPDGFTAVANEPTPEKLEAIAIELDSNYENLTESEKQTLLTQAESIYDTVIAPTPDTEST